ncbi:hypothetical protein DH2020_009325 [Rehmannia glutinosa]|uniref:Amino acid transporter transmembrane domain-containing protein n=1 Tax=Rehmannia glutinosa TaxID=99300 RepID=A0ABR0X606_REHGL
MENEPSNFNNYTMSVVRRQDDIYALEVENPDVVETQTINGTASVLKTVFNGLNALSGVGLLSIPYALSSRGGLSTIIFLPHRRMHFLHRFLTKMRGYGPQYKKLSGHRRTSFWAKGRKFVSITMYIELYLVATGFLILEGDNLHKLFPNLKYQIGGLVIGGKQSFIFIVSLIVLPTVWLHDMSSLSYISASGAIASFILIGSILWAGAFGGIGFHEKGPIFNYKGMPTALSLYTFCYGAHSVFPTLYTSMRNQKKFTKNFLKFYSITGLDRLLCGMYNELCIHGTFGILHVRFKGRISNNSKSPTHKISSKVAIYTTLVNPITKYALMVTPIISALETRFLSQPNEGLSILIRTSLVLSTLIVAMALPFFENLISLVGALSGVTASIILPCLCFSKISGIYKRVELKSISIWGIVLMGVFVLVLGTYTSLREIFKHLI